MTDTKQLKDEELKKVAGGEGTTTYKYVFTNKDWVFENSMRTVTIFIEENVSTNDDSKKICCSQGGGIILHGDPGASEVYYSASSLLKCYKGNGGNLHAM